jgi:hypothetical protein
MNALIQQNKLNTIISIFLIIIMVWCLWMALTKKHVINDPVSGEVTKKINMLYVYLAAIAGILFLLSVMSLTGSGKSLEEEILGDIYYKIK